MPSTPFSPQVNRRGWSSIYHNQHSGICQSLGDETEFLEEPNMTFDVHGNTWIILNRSLWGFKHDYPHPPVLYGRFPLSYRHSVSFLWGVERVLFCTECSVENITFRPPQGIRRIMLMLTGDRNGLSAMQTWVYNSKQYICTANPKQNEGIHI